MVWRVPCRIALYLRCAPIEPSIGRSPLAGDDHSCGAHARPNDASEPATSFYEESGHGSLSQQRQSAGPLLLRCAGTIPADTAAPSPPADRHEAGPMAWPSPKGDLTGEDFEKDNRESWPTRMATGMTHCSKRWMLPCPPHVRRDRLHQARCQGEAIGACWTIGAAATGISAGRFARH